MTARLWKFALHATAALLLCLALTAQAAPPSFTGGVALTTGRTSIVNLRAQGAITGSAPIDVQVNAVRVGGILSPLISIVRSLVPATSSTVCLQIGNVLGLDLSILGVEVDVTAYNADAPGGVPGRVVIRAGLAPNDVSPLACADAAVGATPVGVAPVANAGPDQTVADTDRLPGEDVTLTAGASQDADGSILSYQWSNAAGQQIATGVNPVVRLIDGESVVTLLVTDNQGNTASDSVLVTVAASAATLPIANAGADRRIPDTDDLPGENVTLDGSASTDSDGVIVTYQWLSGGKLIGTGVTVDVRLPDGNDAVTLVVFDDQGNTASAVVQISVAVAPVIPVLSALPGLSPNQRSVAVALDSLCPRLAGRESLTPDQLNLLTRCNGIVRSSTTSEQIHALDEITPQDLNATRTQTFNLSRSQLAQVGDRLIALRSGARGLSLTGLNLNSNDQVIPIEQVASSWADILGGGASADEAERGGLLDDRIGIWLRGNYSLGSKEADIADHGFDADQWGMTGGLDYRLSPENIVGLAIGYGTSNVDFSPYGSGDLATTAITAAIYGTMYTKKGFYVDAIASYLQADYGSRRHLEFTEGGAPIDLMARGSTDGSTLGVAFTVGYDFNLGGFTIAPSVGYNYMMSNIDGFREAGAAGLDLDYLKQDYVSATANAGLRMSYAWNTRIAVVMPQVRGEYIREFIDDTESFGVRFANDPFKDTPLIVVTTAVPDRSYYRFTAGVSAQFRFGISGFVEYQRLANQDLFDYADVAFGLRLETAL
ncbi:MAG: autotransporter domain-containing protein [Steroidobacteraceae bacterium]